MLGAKMIEPKVIPENLTVDKSDDCSDTDGETLAHMRDCERRWNARRVSEALSFLKTTNLIVEWDQQTSAIMIQAGRYEFFYYPQSQKWRQRGKTTYYRCKSPQDLYERFLKKHL